MAYHLKGLRMDLVTESVMESRDDHQRYRPESILEGCLRRVLRSHREKRSSPAGPGSGPFGARRSRCHAGTCWSEAPAN